MRSYRGSYALKIAGLSVLVAVGATILGGKYANAANAANAVIVIWSDTTEYSLADDSTGQIVVKNGANVKINLNGKTLRTSGVDSVIVEKGATATIEGDGTVPAEGTGVAPIYNNGDLTINGGTYLKDESKGAYYAILNHGNLTFNNGTVKMDNFTTSSLVDDGYYNFTNNKEHKIGYVSGVGQEEPTMTINGGTFTGGAGIIKVDDNGTLTINDGTFSANYPKTDRMIIMNNHVATINGGTFKAAGGMDTVLINRHFDGGHNEGTLTINGGSFVGQKLIHEESYDESSHSSTDAKTIVTGGDFTKIDTVKTPYTAKTNMPVEISGGTFKKDTEVEPAAEYKTIDINGGDKKVVPKDYVEPTDDTKKDDKEVTKPRAEEAKTKESGAAKIAAPNTGAELDQGSMISGFMALLSAGLAVFAKIKL